MEEYEHLRTLVSDACIIISDIYGDSIDVGLRETVKRWRKSYNNWILKYEQPTSSNLNFDRRSQFVKDLTTVYESEILNSKEPKEDSL